MEKILSTEERRPLYAGRALDPETPCARPGCTTPFWLHDTNAGIPGGACLADPVGHCNEFVEPKG